MYPNGPNCTVARRASMCPVFAVQSLQESSDKVYLQALLQISQDQCGQVWTKSLLYRSTSKVAPGLRRSLLHLGLSSSLSYLVHLTCPTWRQSRCRETSSIYSSSARYVSIEPIVRYMLSSPYRLHLLHMLDHSLDLTPTFVATSSLIARGAFTGVLAFDVLQSDNGAWF